MSPKAQRIAIAKACGWHSFRDIGGESGTRFWGHPSHLKVTSLPTELIPDYLSDLNAMQAVCEATLTEDEWEALATTIFDARTAGGRFPYRYPSVLLRADAATWCYAFLKVKGLWKEGGS